MEFLPSVSGQVECSEALEVVWLDRIPFSSGDAGFYPGCRGCGDWTAESLSLVPVYAAGSSSEPYSRDKAAATLKGTSVAAGLMWVQLISELGCACG